MFCPLPFNTLGVHEDLKRFTLLCYTDGLTESMNLNEEEYGPERLLEAFRVNKSKRTSELNTGILTEVDVFRQNVPYRDDVTLLSCTFQS